jgi:hypothetical protein
MAGLMGGKKPNIQVIILAVVVIVGISTYVAYSKNFMGLRDKINKKLGKKEEVPAVETPEGDKFPENAIPGGTNVIDIEQPSGGTGQVPISEAGKLQEYTPKPDETINSVFQQELYKQIYLPYDKYPYLYDENYRQALAPPASQNPFGSPINTVAGYRPPIQGGDIPPQDTNLDQYYASLYKNYGMYPPGGGGGPEYDFYYPNSYPYPYGLPPNYPYGMNPNYDPLSWTVDIDAGQTDDFLDWFNDANAPPLTGGGACQYPVPPAAHGNRTKCSGTYGGACLVECRDPCSQLCKDCVNACGPDSYDKTKMAKVMRKSYAALKYRERINHQDKLLYAKAANQREKEFRRERDAMSRIKPVPKYVPAGNAWNKGYIADLNRD